MEESDTQDDVSFCQYRTQIILRKIVTQTVPRKVVNIPFTDTENTNVLSSFQFSFRNSRKFLNLYISGFQCSSKII